VAAVLGVVGFVVYQLLLAGPPEPRQVAVPTLAGLSEQDARNQITALGLRVGEVTQVESRPDEILKVVSSDPPASTAIAERSPVNLAIGRGPAEVNVPRLLDRSAAEAEQELTAVGLVLGTTTEEETADAAKVGKVIRTDPEPGEKVGGGTPVNIVVGTEQTTVRVPDVEGDSIDDAVRALQAPASRSAPPPRRSTPASAVDWWSVPGRRPAARSTREPRSPSWSPTGRASRCPT
jgi:serine/threonine-protein kinase